MKKAALVLIVLLAAGCTSSSLSKESGVARQQLNTFETNQPIPSYPYSQLRQNLIELQNAQAGVIQTTTFFFNQGIGDPVDTCPSIGFPIPASDQLTNPYTKYPSHDVQVGQIDPTGVYTGPTTGTYVICVNAAGKGYAVYWEGFVYAATGATAWDYTNHRAQPVTNPTAQFTTHK